MKKIIGYLLVMSVVFASSNFAEARGSRSSGSRSSSSRSSSSWGSSSRKSTPAKSTSSWGSSKTRKSTSSAKPTVKKTPTYSKADNTAMAKAKTAGTSYKSKAEATSAFKSKHAKQYTSSYTTKPTTRPTHIPQSTKVGGKDVNVTYNVNHGGYGYMGASGSWMAYNSMADVAMMSVLMRQNSYAYNGMYAPTGHNVVQVRHAPIHSDTGTVLLWIFIIGIVVVVCVIVAKKS